MEFNESKVSYLGGTPPNKKRIPKNKPPKAERQTSKKQHIWP